MILKDLTSVHCYESAWWYIFLKIVIVKVAGTSQGKGGVEEIFAKTKLHWKSFVSQVHLG